MINTVLLILVSAWVVALTVLGERERTKKLARKCDIITSAVGVAAVIGGIVASRAALMNLPAGDFLDWASATEKTFYLILFPVFALLFAVCAVTSAMSYANRKLRHGFTHKLRVVMIAVSSVFLSVLSYVGYIGTNETLPLDLFFVITGAGLSCAMRVCSIIENRGKAQ